MVEFKDPVIMLKTIFLVNVKEMTKFSQVFLAIFTFYSLVHCVQMYYLYKNFDVNLLIKYAPATTATLFVSNTKLLSSSLNIMPIFSVVSETKLLRITTFIDKTFWPLDSIRKEARIKLERKCRAINISIYCILLLLSVAVFSNFPCFGRQDDFFLCIKIFKEYFGQWSSIPNYIYFTLFPIFCYPYFRIAFSFVYAILETQLQFSLIEEYLFEVYQMVDLNWKYLQDPRYQQEIGKSLQLCIEHHTALKKLIHSIVNITLTGMPIFLLFGIGLFVSCFVFIINFGDTMTMILKLKTPLLLYVATMLSMTLLMCWNGQQVIDVTSRIFYTLVRAPFYFWNLYNMKVLLMFITNCTRNENIVLAGICLDYTLSVSILRISVFYTLGLLELRNHSFD
ncbi:odorant receptor 202 [Tribolium castaneum]|uniref:Odorant receptor n=1 Tax=Tribolium castaneum TaxID=7070 RepID=D6X3G1_TRICA|nr:odorant receptor 202 [Tribolium castaneum]